jgi:alpha-beta hydrolase superfamily lysophospholipase
MTPLASSSPTAAAPDFKALPGATASFGMLDSAAYRIEMPQHWNGELVLWAHGFAGIDEDLAVSNPPRTLRRQFIDDGYAWAASSYSESGYIPATAADDTLALKRLVTQQFGEPKRTYILGQSMGGAVVTLSLEQFPAEYAGGVSFCGAVGGETEVNYLTSWSLVAAFLAGQQLPIGDGVVAVGLSLQHAILPALGDVTTPSQAGKQFESVMRNLTGGPRPFFVEGFRQSYLSNFGLLLFDPDRSSPAGRAATNADAQYHVDPGLGMTDTELNGGVRRLAADLSAGKDAPTTSGKLGKPLLTLHNTGDLLVPIAQEVGYRQKATAAGAGDLLVQRAIRDAGHCQFSDAELTAAWHDLANWVQTGTKPGGDDLSGDLTDVGRAFTQPLRPGDPGTP